MSKTATYRKSGVKITVTFDNNQDQFGYKPSEGHYKIETTYEYTISIADKYGTVESRVKAAKSIKVFYSGLTVTINPLKRNGVPSQKIGTIRLAYKNTAPPKEEFVLRIKEMAASIYSDFKQLVQS